ncbi:MAG: hypothetical protein HUU08_13240 [Candidatus Brocadia sp.]|nr:hypothetical protein [Candidatus Brocadia sp.]
MKLAKEIRYSYPESKLLHSHPLAQQWHDDALTRRSVKDAIWQIIDAYIGKPSDLSYFVSHPSKVEGYLVSVVLGLQTDVLKTHPSLKKESIPIHEHRSMPVPISLIDAVVTTYLDKASGELRLPEPGCSPSEMNADDIIREGANKLMMWIAYRADQSCI